MGLDFSHTDAHWSYGGFNRARTRLAAVLGHDFDMLCNEGVPADHPLLKDAIAPLLMHSDCDGELSPEECRNIAPRLRELIAAWDDDDFDRGEFLLLADGMDDAEKANEPLEFT